MNLADPLKDLLRTLVLNQEGKEGAEFYLTRDTNGWWIAYPGGGHSINVRYDHLDELRRNQLIRLEVRENCQSGWPTTAGIKAVKDDLSLSTQKPDPAFTPPAAKGTTDYPREFSVAARARIESARLRANRELEQARKEHPPDDLTTSRWDLCALYVYILNIFRAFTREACGLGKKRVWGVDYIRSQADEFLRKLTIQANFEKGLDRFRDRTSSLTEGCGDLKQAVKAAFEKSEEWKEYENELLEVAELQATPEATADASKAGTDASLTPRKDGEAQPNIVAGGAGEPRAVPALAPNSGPQISTERETTVPDSTFWKERRDDFQRYVPRFHDFWPRWRVKFKKWIVWWDPAPDGLHDRRECLMILNAIARSAITRIPDCQEASSTEPWIRWFDFMRHQHRCEPCGSPIGVSELEWEAGVKIGRPLIEVRRELQLSTFDDPGPPIEWIQDEYIKSGFQASADFCEELAARAFEAEELKRALPVEPLCNAGPGQAAGSPQQPEGGVSVPPVTADGIKPVREDVERALNQGNRKLAVKLRCQMESCIVKHLFLDAFRSLAQNYTTKRTAFNRWQASRDDTPSWADELMRARLLK
jgi:hypothetical protein